MKNGLEIIYYAVLQNKKEQRNNWAVHRLWVIQIAGILILLFPSTVITTTRGIHIAGIFSIVSFYCYHNNTWDSYCWKISVVSFCCYRNNTWDSYCWNIFYCFILLLLQQHVPKLVVSILEIKSSLEEQRQSSLFWRLLPKVLDSKKRKNLSKNKALFHRKSIPG